MPYKKIDYFLTTAIMLFNAFLCYLMQKKNTLKLNVQACLLGFMGVADLEAPPGFELNTYAYKHWVCRVLTNF